MSYFEHLSSLSNVTHKHVHDTDAFSCLNFHVGKTHEQKVWQFSFAVLTFEPFWCFQDWEITWVVSYPRMPVAENHGIYDMFGLPEVPFLPPRKTQPSAWFLLGCIDLTLIFFRIPKKYIIRYKKVFFSLHPTDPTVDGSEIPNNHLRFLKNAVNISWNPANQVIWRNHHYLQGFYVISGG